jgi:hypothetical protein
LFVVLRHHSPLEFNQDREPAQMSQIHAIQFFNCHVFAFYAFFVVIFLRTAL